LFVLVVIAVYYVHLPYVCYGDVGLRVVSFGVVDGCVVTVVTADVACVAIHYIHCVYADICRCC